MTGAPAPTDRGSRSITVRPDTFTLVHYEAGVIAALAAELAERIELPADLQLDIEVDESTLLGWSHFTHVDAAAPAATLAVESGAFEDAHRPRRFSPRAATDVLGRHLFRLRDRLDPAFGAPGDDADIDLPTKAAWDTYAVGRMARLGYAVQRQRRLYQFRVRHGFSDTVDAAFVRLWDGDGLVWDDIVKTSTTAADPAPT